MKPAEKQLLRLPKLTQAKVLDKLATLEANPRTGGAIKLAGASGIWRVRVGDYRIVYEIQDDRQTAFVTIIAHRREVYRGL